MILELSSPLLSEEPRFSDLVFNPKIMSAAKLKVGVISNHNFEVVARATKGFEWMILRSIEWRIVNSISLDIYDPILHEDIDVLLFWINPNEFDSLVDISELLASRALSASAHFSRPIIVLTWGTAVRIFDNDQVKNRGVYFVDLQAWADRLEIELFDQERQSFVGSPISKTAQMSIARDLTTNWIGSLVIHPRKLVVVDLDNTMYEGVLGEVGVPNLILRESHLRLHAWLSEAQKAGILVAVVSKNESEDVDLVIESDYFPLNKTDLFAIKTGWKSKTESISEILESAGFHENALVFVDDNPAEIAIVAESFPEAVCVLIAHEFSVAGLRNIPGLWQWREDVHASKRLASTKANNSINEKLREVSGRKRNDFLSELHTTVSIRQAKAIDIPRAASLAARTNQFNLTLGRSNEAELASAINSPDKLLVIGSMTDRLVDSGEVGIVLLHVVSEIAYVDEFCVSCRALGRKFEDVLFAEALKIAVRCFSVKRIHVSSVVGLRNSPAIEWARSLGSHPDASELEITSTLPKLMVPWIQCR